MACSDHTVNHLSMPHCVDGMERSRSKAESGIDRGNQESPARACRSGKGEKSAGSKWGNPARVAVQGGITLMHSGWVTTRDSKETALR